MNDDLRDYDLKADEPNPVFDGDGKTRPLWLWGIALLVVILGVVAFVWFRADEEPLDTPVETASAPQPSPTRSASDGESQLEIGEVPNLAESDSWLRPIVEQISSHPQLAEWLVTPELIRGFVAVVDNVAEGANPRPHLDIAIPAERFDVEQTEEAIIVDSESYERFDLLIDVVESLDVEGTAELYAAIRPLCDQAYQDLGYPGGSFETTLEWALRRILSVPVVAGPIEVEQRVTVYEFADPALEELSPAGKQLLRLGPDNLRRLQSKVRVLARAIGLEV